MREIFADTGGWMACADRADPDHAAMTSARDAALEQGAILVTSDYVVDETLTLMRLRLGLAACKHWWLQLQGSPRVRWEYIDAERFGRACAMFFQHQDKRFSFTDCSSFTLMRELQIQEALTSDRHFAQAGFRIRGRSRSRYGSDH